MQNAGCKKQKTLYNNKSERHKQDTTKSKHNKKSTKQKATSKHQK